MGTLGSLIFETGAGTAYRIRDTVTGSIHWASDTGTASVADSGNVQVFGEGDVGITIIPGVNGNWNDTSKSRFQILSEIDAILTAPGGGGGDIKSDGSVAFTGAETFNAGLLTNSISERTAGSGVTIDGILLKDGGSVLVAGAVGSPSFAFTGSLTTGFYSPAANQIGVAVSGALDFLITANTLTAQAGSVIKSNVFRGTTADTDMNFGDVFTVTAAAIYPSSNGTVSLGLNGGTSWTSLYLGQGDDIGQIFLEDRTPTGSEVQGSIHRGASDEFWLQTGADPNTSTIKLKQDTGWTLPTGTGVKTGFDADWTQSISASYTQSEIQAIVTQLRSVQRCAKSMMDHLMTNMQLFTT